MKNVLKLVSNTFKKAIKFIIIQDCNHNNECLNIIFKYMMNNVCLNFVIGTSNKYYVGTPWEIAIY